MPVSENRQEPVPVSTRSPIAASPRRASPSSDLSADSWILLAERAATSSVEAKACYERAVAAGRQAIVNRYGEELFEDEDGEFWLILDTRPYMRARAGLAGCLWEEGNREEAAEHLQDMLRLNPADNQGLRAILKSWLFALKDFKGVDEILVEYSEEDCFADWCYSKAFLLFRQSGGKASGAINVLKYAVELNPFVPDLLIGVTPMPKSLPAYYGIGTQEEAVLYVALNRQNWSATKGALQWLAENR